MEDYAKYIDNLAMHREPMIFFNHGAEHAGIVMSTIFKYSNDEIRMFVGNFNGKVSSQPNYLYELRRFLERKGKVKILIQDFQEKYNPQLYEILKYYQFFNSDSVRIKMANAKMINGGPEKTEVHFTVGDKAIYRLEENIKEYSARGSFNDQNFCSNLINLFDTVFEQSPLEFSLTA